MKILDSILAIFGFLAAPTVSALPARPIQRPHPIEGASVHESFRNAVAEIGFTMKSQIEKLHSENQKNGGQ